MNRTAYGIFTLALLGLFSLPVLAQNDNTAQNAAAATAPAMTTDSASDNTMVPQADTTPRPVPKRLTAQERWNRLSFDERNAIINEWQKLDETVRPVFPIYRDNALEQQSQQTGTGNATAIAPVTSAVSIPVPSTTASTTQENGNSDDMAAAPLVPAAADH